jgi:hypothetical protein
MINTCFSACLQRCEPEPCNSCRRGSRRGSEPSALEFGDRLKTNASSPALQFRGLTTSFPPGDTRRRLTRRPVCAEDAVVGRSDDRLTPRLRTTRGSMLKSRGAATFPFQTGRFGVGARQKARTGDFRRRRPPRALVTVCPTHSMTVVLSETEARTEQPTLSARHDVSFRNRLAESAACENGRAHCR